MKSGIKSKRCHCGVVIQQPFEALIAPLQIIKDKLSRTLMYSLSDNPSGCFVIANTTSNFHVSVKMSRLLCVKLSGIQQNGWADGSRGLDGILVIKQEFEKCMNNI
jgi:hypothetical protein